MTIDHRKVGRLTPDLVEVSLRVEPESGPVAPAVMDAPRVAERLAAQREVLLLIHGFNNDMEEARKAYETFRLLIADRLGGRGLDLAALGLVYWSGDADLGAIDALDFVSYPTDVRDALGSARVLAPFLAALVGPGRVPPRLTIVAHSLGCRLALEVLKLFNDRDAVDVRAVFLMAAALPVDLVQDGAELEAAARKAADRLVLYSPGDNVLRVAFPLGQGLAYTMGFEQAPYFDAVGLYGEPAGFAPAVRCLRSYFTMTAEHGHYWQDDFVAATVLDRLQAETRHLAEEILDERPLAPPREAMTREIPARGLGS